MSFSSAPVEAAVRADAPVGLRPASSYAATGALTAMVILFTLLAVQALAMLGFLIGISISPAHLPLAFIVATAATWASARSRPVRQHAWATFLALALAVLSTLASGVIYDISYDGQSYHQSAVMLLADGWNPLRKTLTLADTVNATWVNHYAKGPWLVEASLYRLTGAIQQAKAFNFVLLVATGLATWGALVELAPRRPGHAAIVAALAALNPVAICQVANFYIDGHLGSLLTCMAAFGALWLARGGMGPLLSCAAAAALAANVKFTGVAYAALFAGGVVVVGWFLRGRRPAVVAAVTTAAALAVAVLGIGFNPYVTNLVRHGHPFHPLAGKAAVNLMENQTPTTFPAYSRLRKLAVSLFSASENNYGQGPTRFKVPFTVESSELEAFHASDVRIAGFGPFFGGSLMIALALLVVMGWRDFRARWPVYAFILVTAVSCLINPEVWWARYVPQMWLVPVAAAALALLSPVSLGARRAGGILAACLAFNVHLVGTSHTREQVRGNLAIRQDLRELQQRGGELTVAFRDMESCRLRLDSARIPYRIVDEAACVPERELARCRRAVICRAQ